jgi:serine/threonine protein kinase
MDEAMIWKLFIQVVDGMKQLHQLGIFHRDIKVMFWGNVAGEYFPA